jgi:hypothetical protein
LNASCTSGRIFSRREGPDWCRRHENTPRAKLRSIDFTYFTAGIDGNDSGRGIAVGAAYGIDRRLRKNSQREDGVRLDASPERILRDFPGRRKPGAPA